MQILLHGQTITKICDFLCITLNLLKICDLYSTHNRSICIFISTSYATLSVSLLAVAGVIHESVCFIISLYHECYETLYILLSLLSNIKSHLNSVCVTSDCGVISDVGLLLVSALCKGRCIWLCQAPKQPAGRE